ncbi:MAG: Tic22 family protein [bacterium]
MKSLIRWTATLGLVGTTMLTSLLGSYSKALALPEEQIVKTLQSVPVFAIADDQGVPLIAVGEKEQKFTGVFISKQDAQNFFERLKKENPEVASKVKVRPVSLADVYRMQTSQTEQNRLIVDFVPKESEVESAKKLLSERGQQYQGGVPLFVPKAGKEGSFLMIRPNNQDVIPFFFEKATALQMVEQYKKDNPAEAATVKIDVVPLETVISSLQQSNDEFFTKIILFPSQEMLNFIRANINQNAPNQPPANQPRPNNNTSTPPAPNR